MTAMVLRKFLMGVWVCAVVGLAASSKVSAAENNFYRAGYVMGFQDAGLWKVKDPSVTAGRYADVKRDMLATRGPVPRNFWRGLRDGFRDAVRDYKPKFTRENVRSDELPEHLQP